MRVLLALILLFPAVAGARTIDGMYVKAYGNHKDQPIVFIHGGPGYNSWGFEFTTARPLSKQGYYVVVYDQRGQGRSAAVDSRLFNYRRYADDLKKIIDEFQLKDPVLIGHSHGGPIAIKFDEYYPNVAKKIVLVSAPVVFRDTLRSILENSSRVFEDSAQPAKRDYVAGLYYQLFLDSTTPATPQLVSGVFGAAIEAGLMKAKHPSASAPDLWRDYGRNTLKVPLSGSTAAMPGFLANENYVHFSGLDYVFAHKSKFCAIYGDEDGLFTPLVISVVRNALQPSFRLIHGASHDVFVDQQLEFFKALKETCGL